MIYNEYGKTGLKISAVGMGGMRFENPEDTEACASLIKAAHDSGINYFDTAPGYGKSEDLYGAAFREMLKTRRKKPFYVATKTFGENPSDVRRDLENSLKRMGLDHIDFYHVWCIISLDGYRERKRNGAIKEFEKLKDEGLIRHICVSSHMAGSDIREMLADHPFEGLLLGYSIMNFAYRDEGIAAADAAKIGVVVMNPLGGGIIPQNPDRFSFVKTKPEETVVEGALRFLINDRRISTSLVGFANKTQLAEAIAAVDGFEPLEQSEVSRIRENLKKGFNELCTACRYCDACPENIPIPKLMDAYNRYILSDKKPESITECLYWIWDIGIDDDVFFKCTGCGACEKKCTQHLPIRERLKLIKGIVEKAREMKAKESNQ
ncbi:MAG: aldo/keto reductase [Lentisphaerae bacterium]|nr:aldo/keto reductase [Lentisphaerota bacterium]